MKRIEPFRVDVSGFESKAVRNMLRNFQFIMNKYLFEQGVIDERPDYPVEE